MKKTFNCFFCNDVHEEEDPIMVKCSIPGFKMYACNQCVKKLIAKRDRKFIYHDGTVWTIDSRPDTKSCCCCGKLFIPSEKAVEFYKGTTYASLTYQPDRCCMACMKKHYEDLVYCFECGTYHKKGQHLIKGLAHNFRYSYGRGGDINFVGQKDSKSWHTNGEENNVISNKHIEEMMKLPFQEVRELPQDIISEINKFYCYFNNDGKPKISHYNFWDNVDIRGELLLKFGSFEQDLRDSMFKNESCCYGDGTDYGNERSLLTGIKKKDLEKGIKQNKYRNMYFDSIDDDGYVIRKYIDIFGNQREKKESVNVFYQAQGFNINNNSATMKLRYRLSSDLRHKLDAFKRNDAGNFNSCQRSGNSDGLSKGAYDTITNGCICPILIYKVNEPNRAVGRITTRLMYDNDGEMYILLERLYHDGSFSKQIEKGEVYKQIILDLKRQGYKVIVSNYSAHDNSTLNYVQSLGLKHIGVLTNLYQPLRELYKSSNRGGIYGYYADGGTECLTTELNGMNWSTDFLDKAYLL